MGQIRRSKVGQTGWTNPGATINRELTALKHFFSKCVGWRLVAENPFRLVVNGEVQKVRFFKEGDGRTRWLTEAEANDLLAACNPEFRIVVLTALHTGLRSSELKSLKWQCLDLRNRTLTVESAYSKNYETKTVPITEELAEIFTEMQRDRMPEPAPEAPVFVSRYGKPWKSWRTAFENAVKRAGLKDCTFHTLRHTFGSHLGMADTNLKAMMELMGHKVPKMTMRYTHLSMDYKRRAVEKLPKFGTKSPQISPLEQEGKVVGFAK